MNIGTIGTGEVTRWVLTCWKELGNSCYAMYSRDWQRGEALRKQFYGKKVYTKLDTFFADKDIDVVYIASPNSLHFSHAKAALQAGKHVILEKPFTATLAQCNELIALAKANKCILMEGITVMDLPNAMLLKRLLMEIGPIHMSVANMSKVSSKYASFLQGERPNVFQSAYAGGALMDLNVYNLHLMTLLFGMPKSMSYTASLIDGIDLGGCVSMEYENHIALCIASKNSEAASFVELQGEQGFLRIHSASATLSSISMHHKGTTTTYQLQDHELTHIYYVRAFVKMIEEQDMEERDRRLAHTYDVMQLLVEARASAHIVFEADL